METEIPSKEPKWKIKNVEILDQEYDYEKSTGEKPKYEVLKREKTAVVTLIDENEIETEKAEKYGYVDKAQVYNLIKEGKDININRCYLEGFSWEELYKNSNQTIGNDLKIKKFEGIDSFFYNNNFINAYFADDVNLISAFISEDTYFFFAQFQGNANFHSVKFHGNANFNSVKFYGRAYFFSTKFFGNAYFHLAHFYLRTNFHSVYFANETNFRAAQFKEMVNFNNTIFTGETDFAEINFSGYSFFHSAQFFADADFTSTQFSKDALFISTQFSGNAYFSAVQFHKRVSFETQEKNHNVVFKKEAQFKNTYFVQPALFTGTIFEIADFNGVVFKEYGSFKDCVIKKADRETFRIIKNEFVKINNKIDAAIYHKKEMEAYSKELREDTNILEKIPEKFIQFFNWISNIYGSNWLWGVGFTILAGFLFFFFYNWSLTNFGCFCTENLKYFPVFLYAGHNFDFMKDALIDFKPTWLSYSFDMLGRIIIGYGYYQIIQPLKKFKMW
ncbi:MAG: pentapeptide repeat-containing protein [Bacteroidota bacterium]